MIALVGVMSRDCGIVCVLINWFAGKASRGLYRRNGFEGRDDQEYAA